MTYHSDIISLDDTITRAMDDFAVQTGLGYNPYLLKMERLDELRALFSKSDGQLWAMGLKRKDIPAHVFGDLFA